MATLTIHDVETPDLDTYCEFKRLDHCPSEMVLTLGDDPISMHDAIDFFEAECAENGYRPSTRMWLCEWDLVWDRLKCIH